MRCFHRSGFHFYPFCPPNKRGHLNKRHRSPDQIFAIRFTLQLRGFLSLIQSGSNLSTRRGDQSNCTAIFSSIHRSARYSRFFFALHSAVRSRVEVRVFNPRRRALSVAGKVRPAKITARGYPPARAVRLARERSARGRHWQQ